MVIVESRHLKYSVQGVARLWLSHRCGRDDGISDLGEIPSVHLAFHFFDLFFLYAHLYPPIFKLGYELILLTCIFNCVHIP